MKAIFKTHRGNMTIEETREIAAPFDCYNLPTAPSLMMSAHVNTDPVPVSVTATMLTYRRTGIAPDGTLIYEN